METIIEKLAHIAFSWQVKNEDVEGRKKLEEEAENLLAGISNLGFSWKMNMHKSNGDRIVLAGAVWEDLDTVPIGIMAYLEPAFLYPFSCMIDGDITTPVMEELISILQQELA